MTVQDSAVYEEKLPPYTPVPEQWTGYFSMNQMSGLWPGKTEKAWPSIKPAEAVVELRNSLRKQLHGVPCDLSKGDIKVLEKVIHNKYGSADSIDKHDARVWLAHTSHEITVALNDIVTGNKNSLFPELVNAIRCLRSDSAWKYYEKLPQLPLPALNNKTFFKFGGVENPTTMPERQVFTARTLPGQKLTYAMQAISGLQYAYCLENDGVAIFNKAAVDETAKEIIMAVHDTQENAVPNNTSYRIEPGTHRIVSDFKSTPRNQKEKTMNTTNQNNQTNDINNRTAQANESGADTVGENTTIPLDTNKMHDAVADAVDKFANNEKFTASFSKDGVKTNVDVKITSEKASTVKDKAIAVGKFGLKVGIVAGVAYGTYKGVQFIRKGGAVTIAAAGEGAVPVITGGVTENAADVVNAFKSIVGFFKRG